MVLPRVDQRAAPRLGTPVATSIRCDLPSDSQLSVAVQRNPRTILGSAPVPGLQTDPAVTVAVVVDGSRIAFYPAGREAVEVTDTRVTGPATPRITLDRGPGATVRIVGARSYALP